MDHPRFDALARRLAAGATRRASLKAALGGLLGLAALPAAEAGAKKKKRYTPCPALCPSGSACVNGVCACTRPLCGGICCGSDRTSCVNGRCVYTGLRNCDGVAIVDGADLSFCDLRGKSIKNRTLKSANFDGADLSDASLTNYFQPWGCSFRGAKLVGADLDECDIKPGTSFAGADMRGAYLRAGHIDGADFSSANLKEVDFVGGTSFSEPTKIANTRFVQADLSNAQMPRVPIRGSDLTNAILTGAILHRVLISTSNLSGANLTGADLRGSVFTDTTLDGARLDRAEMGPFENGSTGIKMVFVRCSMVNASMTDQAFQGAYYEGPTLQFLDVDLRSARLSTPYPANNTLWLRTDLTGATAWQQPDGGYRYMCDVTLPDGSKAPDTLLPNGSACPRT